MWQRQVDLGMVPYFMFATRDTGAQRYFAVPLARGWDIFREALLQVSGVGRTIRGFVMSALPGKIQVVGTSELPIGKVFVLRMIQARLQESWGLKPFFAKYDPTAVWIEDLEPALGEEEFFYEPDLRRVFGQESLPNVDPSEQGDDYPVGNSIEMNSTLWNS